MCGLQASFLYVKLSLLHSSLIDIFFYFSKWVVVSTCDRLVDWNYTRFYELLPPAFYPKFGVLTYYHNHYSSTIAYLYAFLLIISIL